MGGRILYGITVFVSAFLLFQVQPVIAKYILPWFGAGPGVWAVCLVFFQLVLLIGYAYAHFVVTRLTPKWQAITHVSLLGMALLTLPITPGDSWKPSAGDVPAAHILLVLAVSVGLPYLLLSSTGPLLQGWFARRHPNRSVYRLYALSNVGSLLGLLTYPLWFERNLGLRDQTNSWSLAYGAFVLLCAGCAWTLTRGTSNAPRSTAQAAPPAKPHNRVDVVLWFLLSACGSALLLATTNQLCLDVAVVPFLWVVPLSVYLISFILTFDHARWYVRPFFCALMPVAIGFAISLLEGGVSEDLRNQLIGYPLVLFVLCMCCHGELARIKPAPDRLTFFFLIVALGGAAGGLAVALGAPYLFVGFYEYPLLLILTLALVAFAVARQALQASDAYSHIILRVSRALLWLAAVVAVGWGAWVALDGSAWLRDGASVWMDEDTADDLVFQLKDWLRINRFGALFFPMLALAVVETMRRGRKTSAGRRAVLWVGAVVGGVGLAAAITAGGWQIRKSDREGLIDRGRNFYGVLLVREYYPEKEKHDYTLKHGRITHGYQLKHHPDWPTSYYGPRSGIGLAIAFQVEQRKSGRSTRIGVVGLGSGTMAVFPNATIHGLAIDDEVYVEAAPAPPHDYLRFYEINPMVLDYASRHFTFMSDAKARGADVDVYLGDARLVMEQQLRDGKPERFDVLAIDAFSSDSIPIHLLTKECFEVYFEHLAPMGVLAVHVTNRFIDLKPIVRRLAAELKVQIVHIDSDKDPSRGNYACDWILLTRNRRLYYSLRSETGAVELDEDSPKLEDIPLWTDDYSSVWDQVQFRND